MSRIGRMPINVPAGVEVSIAAGNVVTVKGPKGTLTKALRPEMIIEQNGTEILVKRPSDDKLNRSLHGLTRTLLNNMIVGVTAGYKKELEINGVGYRATKEENKRLREYLEMKEKYQDFKLEEALIIGREGENYATFFRQYKTILGVPPIQDKETNTD